MYKFFFSSGSGHFVPLVVVLVGLPARGKTVLAHKLERYLNWNGHQTRGRDILNHWIFITYDVSEYATIISLIMTAVKNICYQ